MNKNDIFEAEIMSAGSNGEGVCKINNFAVFVPYAVIGDVAEIRILKVNKSYAFGKIEKIIKPSPSRVESNCLAFGKCGGCALQTTSYEKQLEIKRQKVKDALERIGGFSQIEVMPCVESNPCYEYRNKAQYPVSDINGVAETGFYAPRSHRLVMMDNCSLTDSDSKIISKAIIDFANENNVKGYNEETKKGKNTYGISSTNFLVSGRFCDAGKRRRLVCGWSSGNCGEIRDSASGGWSDNCGNGNERTGNGGQYHGSIERKCGDYDWKCCGK
jgi:23S rRNA (uracil1939-C5)-methyltransferase